MKNLIGIMVSYVFIALILISAKMFEKSGKEATRKYIHIMLCNWWFIASYFFTNVIWACMVPLSFVVINYWSYKKGIIDIMERESTQQDGLGTVDYAISLFVLSIFSFGILKRPEIGLVGVLTMGYGDGLAAVMGQTIKSKEYQIGSSKKTVVGSATMFVVTAIIVSIFLMHTPFWYIKAFVVSLLITMVEAISIKGTDNLTVPILTSALLAILI